MMWSGEGCALLGSLLAGPTFPVPSPPSICWLEGCAMTLEEATWQATSLLGDVIAAGIQDGDVDLIKDRATSGDGSVDSFLLAAELADLMGLRAAGTDGVSTVTSEGTTIQTLAADYFAVAQALRAKASSSAGAGIGVITVSTGTRKGGVPSGEVYLTWDGDLPIMHEWQSPSW